MRALHSGPFTRGVIGRTPSSRGVFGLPDVSAAPPANALRTGADYWTYNGEYVTGPAGMSSYDTASMTLEDQILMQRALGLEVGVDVQPYDVRLTRVPTMYPIWTAHIPVTALTSGTPADIGSIIIPDWITRWGLAGATAGSGNTTFAVTVYPTADFGTAPTGTYIVYDKPAADGTRQAMSGSTLSSAASLGATAVGICSESTTLYVHQTAAASSAEELLVSLEIAPCN